MGDRGEVCSDSGEGTRGIVVIGRLAVTVVNVLVTVVRVHRGQW